VIGPDGSLDGCRDGLAALVLAGHTEGEGRVPVPTVKKPRLQLGVALLI
jgi:hypothetical protein